MHIEGDAPGAALDFSAWTQGVEALAWIVDAAELERRAAHRRALCAAPARDRRGPSPAALQVLAEGKASATRERLGVQMPLHAYGQRAVAARLVADRPHAGLARQWFRSPGRAGAAALRPAAAWPRLRPGLVGARPPRRRADGDAGRGLRAAAERRHRRRRPACTALAGERADWPLMLAAPTRSAARLGAAGRRRAPGAPAGRPGAEPGPGRRGDVLAEVLAAREPWRAPGRREAAARYARRARAAHPGHGPLTDGMLHLFASPQPLLRELRNRGLTLVNHLPPLKRVLTARALDA
jgi:2-polyprenyl-6-methoxyphenol hydroxylase-like FAD-dependent oxidoreductase